MPDPLVPTLLEQEQLERRMNRAVRDVMFGRKKNRGGQQRASSQEVLPGRDAARGHRARSQERLRREVQGAQARAGRQGRRPRLQRRGRRGEGCLILVRIAPLPR